MHTTGAGTLSPLMRTRSLRWSFCSTARTGKSQQFKATAPRGAAARYTEGRTDFGGGYFLCLGGEHYEKTEKLQADKVHGENLPLR